MPSAGPTIRSGVSKDFILITCEHGGNAIPARFRSVFAGHETVLQTHRGYDRGALPLAKEIAASFSAPLHAATVTRLLVDLNRSPRHPRLFSEFTRPLPLRTRQEILDRHYLPYRTQVQECAEDGIRKGLRVIHLSSHSFTPELEGEVRNADIGLLYDPERHGEVHLCRRWQAALKEHAPALKVRMNYPYSGNADGLTAALRKRFSPDAYVGIELELNQLHAQAGRSHWRALCAALILSLRQALG